MVKVGKCLTKEELLKETYELEQKVARLEIQVEILKDVMINRDLKPGWPIMSPWQPYICPYYHIPNDTTGDPLPLRPNITICYD